MGIYGFGNWIKNQNPKQFSKYAGRSQVNEIKEPNIDVLAIDFNGFIHGFAAKYLSDDQISDKYGRLSKEKFDVAIREVVSGIFRKITDICYKIRPTGSLMICTDGSCPTGKMNQQRYRRFKTAMDAAQPLFDRSMISPGTYFMKQVSNQLKAILKNRTEKSNFKSFLPRTIVFSSDMSFGEGEHKINAYFREMVSDGKVAVVHGLDSDLVLIFLNQLNTWRNIYLMKEETDYNGKETVSYINLKFLKNNLEKNLKQELIAPPLSIEDIINPKSEYNSNPIPEQDVVKDFSLIMCFIGNDFLPKQIYFETRFQNIDFLLDQYKNYLNENPGDFLFIGESINWWNVKKYLEYLKRFAPTLLDQVANTKWAIRPFEIPTTQTEFKRKWYNYIFSPKSRDNPGYNSSYYTEEDIKNICQSYLNGLNWVYNYYNYGVEAINVDWTYGFHYCPDFFDLADYITQEFIDNVTQETLWPSELRTITVNEQMLMIMTKRSLMNTGTGLHKLTVLLDDYFPSTFVIDGSFKLHDYMYVPIIPIPDKERVQTTYEAAVKLLAENNISLNDPDPEPDMMYVNFRYFAPREDDVICELIDSSGRRITSQDCLIDAPEDNDVENIRKPEIDLQDNIQDTINSVIEGPEEAGIVMNPKIKTVAKNKAKTPPVIHNKEAQRQQREAFISRLEDNRISMEEAFRYYDQEFKDTKEYKEIREFMVENPHVIQTVKNLDIYNSMYDPKYFENLDITNNLIFRNEPLTNNVLDLPRLPYIERAEEAGELRTNRHIGRIKLFISEIEFFMKVFRATDDLSKYAVVYIGSSPGYSILYEMLLFPGLKFYCYDGRPTKLNISDLERLDADLYSKRKADILNNFKFFQQHLDETTIPHLMKMTKGKTLLFISDIRGPQDPSNSEDEILRMVEDDMEIQRFLYEEIKAEHGMFKFRLPWNKPETTYLDGEPILQVFPRLMSSETRLITQGNNYKKYDNREYEEKNSYHNKLYRCSIMESYEDTFSGCRCFDCTKTDKVIKDYYRKFNYKDVLSEEKMFEVIKYWFVQYLKT